MRIPSSYPIAARLTRIALAGLLMTACAGCSSALRFDDPFSNPFLGKADTTGSVAKASAKSAAYRSAASVQSRIAPAAASGRVTSAPLPAPGTAAIQQLRPRAPTEARAGKLVTGAPDTTGSIGRKAGVGTAAKAMPGWSTQGGSPVTLGRGETIETVANRYGVPAPVLLHVNGLSHSSQAVPGQKLIIPTYSASRAGLSSDEAERFAALITGNPFVIAGAPTHLAFAGDAEDGPRDVLDDRDVAGEKGALSFADQDAAAAAGTRKIRSVSSIAAPISIKPPTAIAAPKPVAAAPVTKAPAVASGPIKAAKPKIDAKVAAKTAPAKLAVKQVAAKPAPAKTTDKKPAHILAAAPKAAPVKVAGKTSVKPAEKASPTKAAAAKSAPSKTLTAQAKPLTGKPATAPASKVAKAPVAAPKVLAKTDAISPEVSAYAADPAATGSLPPLTAQPTENGLFRWPAKGRVISSFGSKDISGTNNGINISMPEGTPIKAAEAGTVAYSGDDIKKYGKLVLIKHENGYVSAYAHNGELDVKKGEPVKRGQIIAKSGATGDVTSPQLHFQLRKGEQPVDPIRFLDAN